MGIEVDRYETLKKTLDKKRYGHPRFYELLDMEAKLHSRKAHDYASDEDALSNFRQVAAFIGVRPAQVALMFLATKFYRLQNLTARGNAPMNESVLDTLNDISIYSKLYRILLEEEDDRKPDLDNGAGYSFVQAHHGWAMVNHDGPE